MFGFNLGEFIGVYVYAGVYVCYHQPHVCYGVEMVGEKLSAKTESLRQLQCNCRNRARNKSDRGQLWRHVLFAHQRLTFS